MPYSQALCIKNICNENTEAKKNLGKLKDMFLKRGYREKPSERRFF